jgi:plasmid stabilization system protein ParE
VKVRWTRRAALDLADVAGFIAADNPPAAVAVVRKIKTAANKAGRLPRRGRVVPELGADDIRELSVGHYRIVYRLAAESIEILTVFEGQRQLPAPIVELENE